LPVPFMLIARAENLLHKSQRHSRHDPSAAGLGSGWGGR
jgi:hypothetical protein